jgi:hypothetical protein
MGTRLELAVTGHPVGGEPESRPHDDGERPLTCREAHQDHYVAIT